MIVAEVGDFLGRWRELPEPFMRRIPTVTKRKESAHVGALLDEGFETFGDSITV